MPKPKSTPQYQFNPQSLDATLATILAEMKAGHATICTRMDAQDVKLSSIETQAYKTNGRVNVLENWRISSTARLAGMAAVVSAIIGVAGWAAQVLLGG